jgi:hypothetical protein
MESPITSLATPHTEEEPENALVVDRPAPDFNARIVHPVRLTSKEGLMHRLVL